MGIDYTACFGYGFEFDGDEDDLTKNLSIVYHGSAYCDEEQTKIVCIKKSIIESFLYNDVSCVEKQKLIVNQDWDDILKDFADKCSIEDPKIGWYLCLNEW